MTLFTRDRHGKHETAAPLAILSNSTTFSSPPSGAGRTAKRLLPGFLAFLALTSARSGEAKEKIVGVPAWTNGSQTYIRIRPDVTTPPVAKVVAHTQLYVWGKKAGWYRVETSDHKFGWVYFNYINAPEIRKVRELSDQKAQQASVRTAHQTIYGSPQLLKSYYSKYSAPSLKAAVKPRGIVLASTHKPGAKAVAVKLAKTPVTILSNSGLENAPDGYRDDAAPLASMIPVERQSHKTLPGQDLSLTSRSISREELAVHTRGAVPPAPEAVAPAESSVIPTADVRPVPRPEARLETSSIASAPLAVTSKARLMAHAAATEASRSESSEAAPVFPSPLSSSIVPVAPAAIISVPAPREVNAGQAVVGETTLGGGTAIGTTVTGPTLGGPVVHPAPVPAIAVPRGKALAPSRPRVASHAAPASHPVSWKEKQRLALRQRMGMNPNTAKPAPLAPISPQELLKAREEYLANRRERYGTPESGANAAVPAAPPAAVQPSGLNLDGQLNRATPLGTSGYHGAASAQPAGAKATQCPKPVYLASRGAPAASAVYRGGSPRDYAAHAAFGNGMANQALSYRGMPYHRGAASPSRGFDCSGLVYFLLRQRGYNPPRTAAGYRGFGKAVARGQWQPGDLLLFANTYKRGISHIGVYLGNGKFVHAATSGTGVRVDELAGGYYSAKYFGARRP